MIYIINQEGLYQNKVNSSLVSTRKCIWFINKTYFALGSISSYNLSMTWISTTCALPDDDDGGGNNPIPTAWADYVNQT